MRGPTRSPSSRDSLSLDGFDLALTGDLAASASAEGRRITGYIVGRSGGKIFLVPAKGYAAGRAIVTVDGKRVSCSQEHGGLSFPVEITQKDGLKSYEINF